jgi:hypothetical protein
MGLALTPPRLCTGPLETLHPGFTVFSPVTVKKPGKKEHGHDFRYGRVSGVFCRLQVVHHASYEEGSTPRLTSPMGSGATYDLRIQRRLTGPLYTWKRPGTATHTSLQTPSVTATEHRFARPVTYLVRSVLDTC